MGEQLFHEAEPPFLNEKLVRAKENSSRMKTSLVFFFSSFSSEPNAMHWKHLILIWLPKLAGLDRMVSIFMANATAYQQIE